MNSRFSGLIIWANSFANFWGKKEHSSIFPSRKEEYTEGVYREVGALK